MAAARDVPILLSHPSSLGHDTGPHPERPARIVAIERELEAHDWLGCERALSEPAAIESLTAVHPAAYVESIRSLAESGGGALDLDTILSSGSWDAALHAAGGAVELVQRLCAGSSPSGMSLHRPPGHHAEQARGMGFCLFNNVAVGARHAIDRLGLERVLILDWDVHHGNGTSDIFHATSQVLYASIHQSPLYPGTGAASDVGGGEGHGYTLNLPVPPGSGDAEFCSLVQDVVAPVARVYEPELLLVSAGYDAHAEDPLAECDVTDAGFARMAGSMRRLADELEVPLGVVLEGGYALGALARGVAETVAVLAADEPPSAPEAEPHPLARAAIDRLDERWGAALRS